ncbi:hypothetical protein U9M48_037599 [Paspalum notatum var. saurae]|uniref:Uncharacterized protein n=1 Tax=Paspalum notatum var. saurae TaxID=547442 RepID=A0AAQ3UGS0_PASNO
MTTRASILLVTVLLLFYTRGTLAARATPSAAAGPGTTPQRMNIWSFKGWRLPATIVGVPSGSAFLSLVAYYIYYKTKNGGRFAFNINCPSTLICGCCFAATAASTSGGGGRHAVKKSYAVDV